MHVTKRAGWGGYMWIAQAWGLWGACNAVTSKVCCVGFKFAACESCPMLGSSDFSQVMGLYSVFVGLVTHLCSPSNVCVECGHVSQSSCTFHLHHAWHSCPVFTALWCGFCRKTYLLRIFTILTLTNSIIIAFSPARYGPAWTPLYPKYFKSVNTRTLPFPRY